MSRSRKKTPIHGIAVCASEAPDKREWHRSFRRAARTSEDHGEFLSHRSFSDIWRMGKDGKKFWKGNDALMRK